MKQWKGKQSVRTNLRARMPGLVDDYFSAGETALAPDTSWEEMHRFRLLTKRFRYTLEIFRHAYGPGIEQRIELLKQVQTLLGEINDCVVTSGMLAQLEGTESVREQLARKADQKKGRLQSVWGVHFQAAGRKEGWRRYLTQYACRPGRISRTHRLPAPEQQEPETSPSAS